MPNSYEHSNFEVHSNTVFSLLNSDDHDRFLTDPAYRLEKITELQQATYDYQSTMDIIQRSIVEIHGRERTIVTKDNFENLILAKIALNRMDRQFKAV